MSASPTIVSACGTVRGNDQGRIVSPGRSLARVMTTNPKPEIVSSAWLNSLTPNQRIEFLKSGWAAKMHAWVSSHVCWLSWQRRTLLGTTSVNNGSAFFLDTGDRLFGVTAAHVIDGYVAEKARSHRTVCQLGNLQIDPEERLISKGDRDIVDIATFRVSRDEVARLGKQAVLAAPWPPAVPAPGHAVFIAGFPGAKRLWLSGNALSFGLFSWSGPITKVSDREIVCAFDRDFWVPSDGGSPPPTHLRLGGLSGCPALLPIERGGSWDLSLGGVVSTGVFDEVLYATRPAFIRLDGTIAEP